MFAGHVHVSGHVHVFGQGHVSLALNFLLFAPPCQPLLVIIPTLMSAIVDLVAVVCHREHLVPLSFILN